MDTALWALDASPETVAAAAEAWRTLADAIGTTWEDVATDVAGTVGTSWSGDAADSYHDHVDKLRRDIDTTRVTAVVVASTLESIAAELSCAQDLLDSSLADLAASPVAVLRFADAVDEAREIRARLDGSLSYYGSVLDAATRQFRDLAEDWQEVAAGTANGWTPPPEATSPVAALVVGGRLILNVTDAAVPAYWEIQIRVDPVTGEQIVEAISPGGAETRELYRAPRDVDLTIRTGPGDDRITVRSGVHRGFTLLGGAGDDVIRGSAGEDTLVGSGGADALYGGRGNDRLSGGAGRDYLYGYHGADLLVGGASADILYGGGGRDRLSGGTGHDYLEGGAGADELDGDAGRDVVSGGRGADELRGGSGDDTLYPVAGGDTVDGQGGDDTGYLRPGDSAIGVEEETRVPDRYDWRSLVEVNTDGDPQQARGNAEFPDRAADDLDLLASSPAGQQMLGALEESGIAWKTWPNRIEIGPGEDSGYFPWSDDEETAVIEHAVVYNADRGYAAGGPPIVGLYHELAHVYQESRRMDIYGVYEGPGEPEPVLDNERAAVGLPLDHDHNPATPERIHPEQPVRYTENGLRDELGPGVPGRERYIFDDD